MLCFLWQNIVFSMFEAPLNFEYKNSSQSELVFRLHGCPIDNTIFLSRRHTSSDMYFRSGVGAPGRFNLPVCDESMESFHLPQKPLIHQRVKFDIKNFIPCILHDR